jgi:TATA-box binding protein (TBP) (component of TFIID and TFIIIB)
MDPQKITPFKVSTITATGAVSTRVCLDTLFDNAPIGEEAGIIHVKHCGATRGTSTVRIRKKRVSAAAAAVAAAEGGSGGGGVRAKKKCFDNQITVLFRDGTNVITAKVFSNGSVQMTGLKTIDVGRRFLDHLVDVIRSTGAARHEDDEPLCVRRFAVNLINSDFNAGFHLRRESISDIMQARYGILCVFESCHYQGLKIQFFWNSDNGYTGVCQCGKACYGRGSGHGDGECKKITIAVFQSGSIIITGANCMEQIQHAYDFMTAFLTRHVDEVKKVVPPALLPRA